MAWWGYIVFYAVLSILSAEILTKKSFFARYKLLNRYNVKYLFLPKEHYPKIIGKCKIESVFHRRRKVFATVKILETGEVKNKVLVLGESKHEGDTVYILHEICNVYYIV